MSDLREDEWSVGRVAERARAYLEAQALKALTEIPEPPPPSEPRLPRQPVNGESGIFLYLIRSGHLVKIGRASNMRMRLSNLCVDNPHGVELVAYYEVPRLVGKHIELLMHAIFADLNPDGEWFEIPPEQAQSAIEKLIALAKEARRWTQDAIEEQAVS